MSILEIRAALPKPPAEIEEQKPCWPAKDHDSAYNKPLVGPEVQVTTMGIVGNAAGHPAHIDDTINRAILVYNEPSYEPLRELFPEAQDSLCRGGFAENFVVNDPSLSPSVVCVGDRFKIGSTLCVVTGPRSPCPKVDGWHATKGLTKYCKENGSAGFFMKVVEEGTCQVGDPFILLARPNPGFTITRISQGLWGSDEQLDKSVEFLSALASMEDLIGKHYRDTAITRLERIS